MSLVTVQRSPTPSDPGTYDQWDDDQLERHSPVLNDLVASNTCYFYVKGTAVILLQPDRNNTGHHHSGDGEMEEHLQAMLRILPPQHTMTMAVRLQANSEASNPSGHVRYLAVVVCTNCHEARLHDVVLLGIDCLSNNKATIGVVIPIYASMRVRLDGDGGVVVDVDPSLYIFRPVSVQAMWTVFQCLQKELVDAQNSRSPAQQFGKHSKRLIDYYKEHVSSDDALRAQWERSALDCYCESSGDLAATAADAERFTRENLSADNSVEAQIYERLKEVMQTVDLDEVTSKDIRKKVEESMCMDLSDYKDFISRQMMVIMGQMDKASQIFPYLFLGTEWNACDWQWLESNGIEYIVNVTNEVENFFPTRLKYLKIRVSDEASSKLLKHWNQTNQFIKEAKQKGGAVLVHCKKGISRSSSTVIAFAMKEYGWELSKAMEHVKNKRDCITPNKGFVEQLKTFEGMLHAFKKRDQFDVIPSTSITDTLEVTRPVACRRVLHESDSESATVSTKRPDESKRRSADNISTVKSLVGSFEAKGRMSSCLSARTDRSLVTFRLRNVTEWKMRDRMTVPVTNSCNSGGTIRQGRALTISQ